MNIEAAIKNLEKRGFDVRYFETGDEAVRYLTEEIQGTSVGFGGSMTVKELGLFQALSEGNTTYSHSEQKDRMAAYIGAAHADVYISSANAIAETGEIVNIDGYGNRLSSTLFNKKRVYFVVGINKFTDNLEDAIWRARNVASPKNARRFQVKTPCAEKADKCYDCTSPERICKGLLVLWGKMGGVGRSEVVIINQELGF